MTEPQLTNSEKEMLRGAPEEKIIFRLKCTHHKVCGYMCTPVCPHRATTSAEVLEKSVRWLETNIPHFSPHHKKWYLEYMQRPPTKAELRSQRGRKP
jgi:hypothetical protein